MMNKRQSEFADAIKPIGVRYPFNIKILCDIHICSELVFLRIKVVKYDAVINSFDKYLPSIEHVEQLSSFLDQFSDANRLYVQVIAGAIKINFCFLLMRLYLEKYNIFRRFAINN